MFVQTNKASALKKYFTSQLELKFSANEIKHIFQQLLEKRLGLSKEEQFLAGEMLLSESDLLFFKDALRKLIANEPLQYLIGKTEFYGLELKCDSRALIPRPETEELVDWIKQSYSDKNQNLRIIDLCTGSGCIALAIAKTFPNAEISALDVSHEALDLCRENAEINQLKVKLFEADLLQKNSHDFIDANSLDCIVSNPPYIPEKDKATMHENVLNFEPHLALFVSNDNPLIFYEIISNLAQEKLKNGGLLFFEIHESLAEDVKNLLLNDNFNNIIIRQDLQGKNRMIKAQK